MPRAIILPHSPQRRTGTASWDRGRRTSTRRRTRPRAGVGTVGRGGPCAGCSAGRKRPSSSPHPGPLPAWRGEGGASSAGGQVGDCGRVRSKLEVVTGAITDKGCDQGLRPPACEMCGLGQVAYHSTESGREKNLFEPWGAQLSNEAKRGTGSAGGQCPTMKMPSRYFRAGVGAVIADADGAVLALERSDVAGAWQLPQGGWESGETVEQAVFREIEEETGLTRRRLILVERYPEPLIYELPRECQSVKAGLGQVQYWFLMRLRGKDLELTLPGGGENSRLWPGCQWVRSRAAPPLSGGRSWLARGPVPERDSPRSRTGLRDQRQSKRHLDIHHTRI